VARRRGSNPEQTVADTLAATRGGLVEHDKRIRQYNRSYQIWRGLPPKPVQNVRPWDSRMRIKYGMQVVDQTMVNVVQGAPKAVCTPRRPDDVGAAKAMEQILAYYADLDHLSESEPLIVQQALVYGVSPAKTMWLYREQDIPRGWNPQTQKWDPRVVTVTQDDRPTLIPWDVYDCWWEPLARDPDKASYVVLREWPTRDELEARRSPTDKPVPGDVRLRNLDELYASGVRQRGEPQTAQNQLLGYPPSELYRDRYEVWEIWRDNRLTIVGNRTILLYDGPKPFWMPGKPVVIGNSRPDFLRIDGIPETELVDDIQQALWTHENLVMENLKMTVMRGATVRETVPDMSQLVLRPNYMWPVTDHDDVHFQDPPPLPPEAYEQRATLLGAMQYVTGINPYVTGGATSGAGVDQSTATGVSVLNNAASKLLEFKARWIALKVYQRSFEQWKDLTQQYLTQPQWIRLNDTPDGWQQYGPQDVYGDYHVRVQAGEESLNRQQKRAEAVALLNALAPFAAIPGFNVQALMQRVADAYGFEPSESLFQAPQGPASAAPGPPAEKPPPAFTNGAGQLTPQPVMSTLMGNAR
jgi:hypothetical protein